MSGFNGFSGLNQQLQKLACTDQTLLITGRTGTGKSHLAREVHDASPRRTQKFMAINLATLSENLIESELFGHEKGAFSGADVKRIGKLEAASGGTVFLDEIGELSLRLQTKLLEALNSRTISPVGSNREVQLDVRILTATNRDLKRMVREGSFREDLFFRINTFQVNLPSLSDQPERISSLAQSFAASAARRQERPFAGISQDCLTELKSYDWPGNVRELKNAMEFAVAMAPTGWVTPDLLPPLQRETSYEVDAPEGLFPLDYRQAKTQFEKSYLEQALFRCEGKINQTARQSGLSKVTLIDKIRRYEIDVPTIKYRAYSAGKEVR